VLAARAPGATVWAVDVNERALALCAANAAAAGLSNVRCVTPDSAEVPSRLAGIWSNPPVRIGKGPLHDMLRQWLARLAPDAGATLVMGRNLGADSLHSWLEKEEGWSVTRLSARSGYRLLQVNHPQRSVESSDGR
jgi:16S rRNA (guanine1207-N2)-methyltransferase